MINKICTIASIFMLIIGIGGATMGVSSMVSGAGLASGVSTPTETSSHVEMSGPGFASYNNFAPTGETSALIALQSGNGHMDAIIKSASDSAMIEASGAIVGIGSGIASAKGGADYDDGSVVGEANVRLGVDGSASAINGLYAHDTDARVQNTLSVRGVGYAQSSSSGQAQAYSGARGASVTTDTSGYVEADQGLATTDAIARSVALPDGSVSSVTQTAASASMYATSARRVYAETFLRDGLQGSVTTDGIEWGNTATIGSGAHVYSVGDSASSAAEILRSVDATGGEMAVGTASEKTGTGIAGSVITGLDGNVAAANRFAGQYKGTLFYSQVPSGVTASDITAIVPGWTVQHTSTSFDAEISA